MTPSDHNTTLPADDAHVTMGRLRPQPWMLRADTQRLIDVLTPRDREGQPQTALAPRFVGGCVRNALANRPVVDIDIATPLRPEDVMTLLEGAGIAHIPTGLKHGTVTALVEGQPYEITTLRVDVMTFGRHADVKFTDDWKTDAARRDFTINAMSCDLDGNVYDYFTGMEDLRQGLVRFVGVASRRIHEDVLRILRYFRFLAHFGRGRPDPDAIHACQYAAGELRKLSGERVRNEVLKLLEAPSCAGVWRLMLQAGVVTHILPEATDWQRLDHLVGLEQTFEVPAFALRRLAAVMVVSPEALKPAVQGLRLSAHQATQLFAMIKYSAALGPQTGEADIRRLVYLHGNDMALSLLLLAASRLGDVPHETLYSTAVSFQPPLFPLTGDDVLACGFSAGPIVGQLLTAVENWWMSEDFAPSRDDCLAQLRLRVNMLREKLQ